RPGDFVTIEVLASYDNNSPAAPITETTSLTSSDPAILKLSTNGTGIAMATGKALITAKLGDQVVGSVEVVVTNATLDPLEITPSKSSIDSPNRAYLSANAVYSDMSKYDITHLVSWSSENPDILNFDQGDGVGVPYALGTASVSAYYNSMTATAQVTVTMG